MGSIAASSFRLAAAAGDQVTPVWVSLRQLNNLPRGYHLRYQPVALPSDADPKEAAITAVVVPKAGGDVTVLQPGSANVLSEWIVPFDVSLVLFVVAPQGLDQKRLTNLVTRDETLVAALADYADQTAELEASLRALRDIESEDLAPRASTPAEQALLTLVRALNPAATSLNPLGTGRRTGPTSMMGRGADMFFENAGGFVPGGGILPSVKGWLMPDTEFRSVYPAGPVNGDITLCAQRQARGRNKIAYIWAYRLTTSPAPAATVAGDDDHVAHAALGLRDGVPLELKQLSDWDLIERVYDWSLVPETGPALAVDVRPARDLRQLRLDLRNFPGGPGLYRLAGRWDWENYPVTGDVRLHRLSDLSAVAPTEAARAKLVSNTGPVPVELEGANLRFIDDVWLHRPESIHRFPVDRPAAHVGPSDRMLVEVDTDSLRPGPYFLALQQADGARAEIPIAVLEQAPSTGPRPRILEAQASLPADLVLTPKDGELPGGSFVSFLLRVDPPAAAPITLACADSSPTAQALKLAPTSPAPGQLFISFDPAAAGPSGCALTAVLGPENNLSEPFPLGKVVHLPRIDRVTLTSDTAPDGFVANIEGWHLETIERTGWSATQGLPVAGLPRPIAGEGAKQTLRIAVPWPSPSPKAPLYIWLRGETEGRATRSTP